MFLLYHITVNAISFVKKNLFLFFFVYLGSTLPSDEQNTINERDRSLVPLCKGLDLIPSYPSILDLTQIVFINAHLPQQYQPEWRFLFSSEIHGESFSTLIGMYWNFSLNELLL